MLQAATKKAFYEQVIVTGDFDKCSILNAEVFNYSLLPA
jgi:hypothetical protein